MFIKVTFSQAADAFLAGEEIWNSTDRRQACWRQLLKPHSCSKRKARRNLERFLAVFGGDGLYLRKKE